MNSETSNSQHLLKDLRDHLIYLQEEGVTELNISRDVQPVKHSRSAVENTTSLDPLQQLRNEIGDCQRCPLSKQRKNIVFGEGSINPEIVMVGEGPGFEEDRTGKPFVGKAGHLLDKIIAAMGLTRNEIYICNVVKCRPPNNRDPELDEMEICGRFLIRQLEILKPKIILTLGRISGRFLTDSPNASITRMRGVFHKFQGIDVRVTYHPAAILRNPGYRRPVWEDIQIVMKKIGRPIK